MNGQLFVVSAPSGAGKSTLCDRVLGMNPGLRYSVSYTTRAPRPGEVDGVDYHFVDRQTFERMIADDRFAEYAEVHGNLYGTAYSTLSEARAAGIDQILVIDVQGARQLKNRGLEAVNIFILPPSRDELLRRLSGRGTDSAEVIAERMRNADTELGEAYWFDHRIVNDDLDRATAELDAIVAAAIRERS